MYHNQERLLIDRIESDGGPYVINDGGEGCGLYDCTCACLFILSRLLQCMDFDRLGSLSGTGRSGSFSNPFTIPPFPLPAP